jgi:hypothetical protein
LEPSVLEKRGFWRVGDRKLMDLFSARSDEGQQAEGQQAEGVLPFVMW